MNLFLEAIINRLIHLSRCHVLAAIVLTVPATSMAQTPVAEPSSQQIIDALKPARTRGTRNLGVREATPETPSSATPVGNAPAATTAPVAPATPPTATDATSVPASTAGAAAQPVTVTPPKPASIDLAIQFEFDSSKVSPASKKTLDILAIALASPELAGLRFRIEGHTDSKGSVAYNQKLSQARANEVKRMLVTQKIAGSRLVTVGKGSSEPLNAADPTAGENRRVRIVSLN